jgi:hypothetical protein
MVGLKDLFGGQELQAYKPKNNDMGQIGIVPASGERFVAQQWEQTGRQAQQLAATLLAPIEDQLMEDAQTKGATAVSITPDGQIAMTDLPSGMDKFSMKFRAGARAAYSQAWHNQIKLKGQELATKHQHDPDGMAKFGADYDEFLRGSVESVLPEFKAELMLQGQMIRQGQINGLADIQADRVHQNQRSSLLVGLKQTADEIGALSALDTADAKARLALHTMPDPKTGESFFDRQVRDAVAGGLLTEGEGLELVSKARVGIASGELQRELKNLTPSQMRARIDQVMKEDSPLGLSERAQVAAWGEKLMGDKLQAESIARAQRAERFDNEVLGLQRNVLAAAQEGRTPSAAEIMAWSKNLSPNNPAAIGLQISLLGRSQAEAEQAARAQQALNDERLEQAYAVGGYAGAKKLMESGIQPSAKQWTSIVKSEAIKGKTDEANTITDMIDAGEIGEDELRGMRETTSVVRDKYEHFIARARSVEEKVYKTRGIDADKLRDANLMKAENAGRLLPTTKGADLANHRARAAGLDMNDLGALVQFGVQEGALPQGAVDKFTQAQSKGSYEEAKAMAQTWSQLPPELKRQVRGANADAGYYLDALTEHVAKDDGNAKWPEFRNSLKASAVNEQSAQAAKVLRDAPETADFLKAEIEKMRTVGASISTLGAAMGIGKPDPNRPLVGGGLLAKGGEPVHVNKAFVDKYRQLVEDARKRMPVWTPNPDQAAREQALADLSRIAGPSRFGFPAIRDDGTVDMAQSNRMTVLPIEAVEGELSQALVMNMLKAAQGGADGRTGEIGLTGAGSVRELVEKNQVVLEPVDFDATAKGRPGWHVYVLSEDGKSRRMLQPGGKAIWAPDETDRRAARETIAELKMGMNPIERGVSNIIDKVR